MTMPALSREHQRYLRLLGVTTGEPGLALLRALVPAHLYRVRFENVSKLLLYDRERAGRPIALTEFLDGIEHHDLGGTCYSSNPFLCELLVALGFDAALYGADMASPNVHTSIRVSLDSVWHHVDVGYAAPFREPIRLDRLPHVVSNGFERYVMTADDERGMGEGRWALENTPSACRPAPSARGSAPSAHRPGPSAPGRYVMSYFVAGVPRHRYVAHPPPRSRDFFNEIVEGSFDHGKTFMECLRLSRQFPDGSADLRDRHLVIHRGGVSAERIVEDLTDLRRVVDNVFGMPRCPVERAVAILEEVTGRPFWPARSPELSAVPAVS